MCNNLLKPDSHLLASASESCCVDQVCESRICESGFNAHKFTLSAINLVLIFYEEINVFLEIN